MSALLEWLQSLPWAVFIQNTPWAFTTIEVVHVFAVSMVLGTIALVDLRLLRLASTKRPFAEFSRQVLPFTWVAFVVAMIAGSLLFISKATEYFANWMFLLKMSLIVLAGINMVIFEFKTVRGVREWNLGPTPRPAWLAGGISIACWVLVVFFGRLIAFTLPTE